MVEAKARRRELIKELEDLRIRKDSVHLRRQINDLGESPSAVTNEMKEKELLE